MATVLYETVIDKAAQKKYWRIVDTLKLSKETPLDTLKAMIQAAAMRFEDDEAADIVPYINDACRDQQFVPLCVDGRLPIAGTREHGETAEAFAVLEMMSVYGVLPPHRVEGQHLEMSQWVPTKKPCLLKTRAALLGPIAWRWASTAKEEEADYLVDFLLKEAASPYTEYGLLAVEAIRKATQHLPTGKRLANAYRKASRGRQTVELLKVLRIAWSRNREDKAFLRDLDVMTLLVHASPETTDYARRCIEQSLEAHRKAAALIKAIKDRNDFNVHHFHLSACGAEPFAALPAGFLLRVALSPDRDLWAHTREKAFDIALAEVKKWRKENPGVPVRLVVEHIPAPEKFEESWIREITIK